MAFYSTDDADPAEWLASMTAPPTTTTPSPNQRRATQGPLPQHGGGGPLSFCTLLSVTETFSWTRASQLPIVKRESSSCGRNCMTVPKIFFSFALAAAICWPTRTSSAVAASPPPGSEFGDGSVGARAPTNTTSSVTTLPAFQQPSDAELVPEELKLSTPTGYPGGSVLLTGRCPASPWADGHVATTNLGPTSFKISADRTFSAKILVPATAPKVEQISCCFVPRLAKCPKRTSQLCMSTRLGSRLRL